MKSIGSLIKKIPPGKRISSVNLDEKTLFFVVKRIIQKEFGDMGAEKFLPSHFSRRTIVIKSQSAPWAAELWANQERIIRKINKELGGEILEKIRLEIGK